MISNKEILTPTNDVIFKRLFGQKGKEKIVKDFLEAILDTEIESVELEKETQLLPAMLDEKIGILDVKVKLSDGTLVDVEMQNVDYGNIEKRMTFYSNQLYNSELKSGRDYNELNKTIAIGILNFEYKKFKNIKDYHSIWKMTEQNNKNETLEEEEIHFIELPKFLKRKMNIDLNKKLHQWLLFIDNPREEMLDIVKEKNENIKEASEAYEYLVGDEAVQRLAFLKRKFELDYNSGMNTAKRKGLEEGLKEGRKKGRIEGRIEGKKEGKKKGRIEGRIEGIKEGIKEGEKRGIQKEKIEIAKKMKQNKIKIEDIINITGLTKEEINEL